jgi:hypothetical protein
MDVMRSLTRSPRFFQLRRDPSDLKHLHAVRFPIKNDPVIKVSARHIDGLHLHDLVGRRRRFRRAPAGHRANERDQP